MIPISSVDMTQLEEGYLLEAFRSGWISSNGDFVIRFEEKLAQIHGRKFAIATCNGTAALHLALLALGIKGGDEVVVPALTFASPAAMVKTTGAKPILADVDQISWCVSDQTIEPVLSERTRAILAVNVLGHPADYDSFEKFGLPVIEDAAESHGAMYKGKIAGSNGVISIFSFYGNKAITTGEGGAVLTDDEELHDKMRLLMNHGMSRSRLYWHSVVGYNYRMTNLTAAIGLAQLERWDELLGKRAAVASQYDELLDGKWLSKRPVADWAKESCWLYTLTSSDRDRYVKFMAEMGIDAREIWPALSELPIYQSSRRVDYTVAEAISKTAFWLPTYSSMKKEDIDFVKKVVMSVAK